jgi:hypothetical protein
MEIFGAQIVYDQKITEHIKLIAFIIERIMIRTIKFADLSI